MTDSMKCPFCGGGLKPLLECGTPVGWYCPNFCKIRCALDEPVWQALIDGKKAQDALNYAIGVLDNLTEIGGVDMEIIKIKKMAGIK